MSISDLISDLISVKEKNKDFALMFEGGEWRAMIGNDADDYEYADWEYEAKASSPDDAIVALKAAVIADGNANSYKHERYLQKKAIEDECYSKKATEERLREAHQHYLAVLASEQEADREWHRTDDGVLVKKYGQARVRSDHRSHLATPTVIRDTIGGDLQSMADGKWYDSKSALRRSYTADGNPQGRDYQEIGGTEIEPAGRASVDKKAVRDAVDKAMHDVETGQIPDSIKAIE